ncbi:hypothetical protein LINPERHAP1_LOCUS21479 [Linum perenne]
MLTVVEVDGGGAREQEVDGIDVERGSGGCVLRAQFVVEALTISNEEIKMREKLIEDLTVEVMISNETLTKLVDDLGKTKLIEVEILDEMWRVDRKVIRRRKEED